MAHEADAIKDEQGRPWFESMDARVWAKAFVAIEPHAEVGGGCCFTEEAMLGWFANAIMRGFDEARSRPADPNTSDGFHTFAELYEHRSALFLYALSQATEDNDAWYTTEHEDGSMFDGYFLVGMDVRTDYDIWERVTYHLELKHMDTVEAMAHVAKLKAAPPFDGHTSADVAARLLQAAAVAA
jgi:hypothetical protein